MPKSANVRSFESFRSILKQFFKFNVPTTQRHKSHWMKMYVGCFEPETLYRTFTTVARKKIATHTISHSHMCICAPHTFVIFGLNRCVWSLYVYLHVNWYFVCGLRSESEYQRMYDQSFRFINSLMNVSDCNGSRFFYIKRYFQHLDESANKKLTISLIRVVRIIQIHAHMTASTYPHISHTLSIYAYSNNMCVEHWDADVWHM